MAGDRRIGPTEPMFVIAEISANHAGSFQRAEKLVALAAESGCDAVKLQTYTADTMTLPGDRPELRIDGGTLWDGRHLHDLYEEAATPWEWHRPLFDLASSLGLVAFSSPFDRSAVDFLVELGTPLLKIASFEVTDLDLVGYAASTGRPLIISTGMATDGEIDAAVRTARDNGCTELVLLRCNSGYPADPSEMDLRTIPDMRRRWDVPVGLSDHTMGSAVAVAARALGAAAVEKHVTVSRRDPTPDAAFSADASELAALVRDIRTAEAALGTVRYGPTVHETPSLRLRRSIWVVRDVPKGALLTADDIRVLRPAAGLPPERLHDVLGQRASRSLVAGEPLTPDVLGD